MYNCRKAVKEDQFETIRLSNLVGIMGIIYALYCIFTAGDREKITFLLFCGTYRDRFCITLMCNLSSEMSAAAITLDILYGEHHAYSLVRIFQHFIYNIEHILYVRYISVQHVRTSQKAIHFQPTVTLLRAGISSSAVPGKMEAKRRIRVTLSLLW